MNTVSNDLRKKLLKEAYDTAWRKAPTEWDRIPHGQVARKAVAKALSKLLAAEVIKA